MFKFDLMIVRVLQLGEMKSSLCMKARFVLICDDRDEKLVSIIWVWFACEK